MVSQTPSEIERQLDGGAWLTSGQITTLLGRGRTTIWRRLRRSDMRWRETPGGNREYNPEDVRRLLAESRRVHGGEADR
jgi:IS30 family transposase